MQVKTTMKYHLVTIRMAANQKTQRIASVGEAVEQRFPNFLAPGTGFVEDNFSMDGEGGWFRDDSSSLHLLCTLFLLLLHCNI